MNNIVNAIKAHIEMIKEFITLLKNLKEAIGDKVDSIDDIKAIIASAKEAITLLKQYETFKSQVASKEADQTETKPE